MRVIVAQPRTLPFLPGARLFGEGILSQNSATTNHLETMLRCTPKGSSMLQERQKRKKERH
ncbi:hypothetical protein KSX_83140 [Ktedonospora formicarum]|uniref:Uncharacterized protein n=1 Tax=Ktedonospora formicarum TaxID=2778364 RepID=A0A8J3I7P9_9CHLR|nr:hypothetical protein KSX_83140 [Ktedonospora formicarum]